MNNQEKIIGVMQKYRNVFSHKEASEVLYHMLGELGYFEQSITPEQSALRNYASRLLGILGGGGIHKNTINQLKISLINQPLPKEKKE